MKQLLTGLTVACAFSVVPASFGQEAVPEPPASEVKSPAAAPQPPAAPETPAPPEAPADAPKEGAAPRSEAASPSPEQAETARPAVPADQNADLRKRVAELESIVADLRKELDDVRTKHEQDTADLTKMMTANAEAIKSAVALIKSNSEAIQAHADVIKSHEELAASTQKLIDANAKIVADNDRKLKDLVAADGQGGYTLDVVGNMQKDEFQRGLQQAVQGKLWIHNSGENERTLFINGTPWRALKGWSFVWVPYGKVGVTTVPGATPVARDDWKFSDTRREFELVYDFESPWK